MRNILHEIWPKIHDRWLLLRYVRPFNNKNAQRAVTSQNTMCLFCSPRGGSTWLAEIFLTLPGTALIDEPLWRGKLSSPFQNPDPLTRKVTAIAELGFFYNQHIPENAWWPEAEAVMADVLAGRALSLGLYDEQGLIRLEKGDFFIAKFCYGNLLMPWLLSRFDASAILLTRHPCAVIASQLRLPSWKDIRISDDMKIDEFPYNDFYRKALEKAGPIDSREKYLALIWALGFRHTAMHPLNNKRWLTIAYERLVTDFDHEIRRIEQRFGLMFNDPDAVRDRPSKSIKEHSLIRLRSENPLGAWQKDLSQKQISDILNVLEKFEIDIYSANIAPDYDKLYS